MVRSPRAALITAVTMVAAAAPVAGCNRPAVLARASAQTSIVDGGTLQVVVAAPVRHLDPQRVRTATEANLSRLISRTLTTFRSDPDAADEVVGDLATDTGKASDGNRTWEFTLKPQARWEDGTEVTCADVKYGIERSFGELFDVSQSYARRYLEDNPVSYQGPFTEGNNAGKGLESVRCVNKRTVRFRLAHPVANFGQVVAASVFAPVPAARDRRSYDNRPFANGPYQISRNDNDGLVLVRNPQWARDSDPVRRAHPDRIVVVAEPADVTLTSNLIDSSGSWADSVALDQDVAPPFLQQVVNDPALSGRMLTGGSGAVRYLALNTRRLGSLPCRKAIVAGLSRRLFQDAMGGALAATPAGTMIVPSGRSKPEVALEADVDAAQVLLQQAAGAGQPCPAQLSVAFPDRADARRILAGLVVAYRALGLRLDLKPIEVSGYADTVGKPDNEFDLIYAEAVPDWLDGAAVIPPLFDGRLIPTTRGAGDNQNLSLLNDQAVNDAITVALGQSEPDQQRPLWAALDEQVRELAAVVPAVYPKSLRLVGGNVRGAFLHPRFAQPDLCALGLATPSATPTVDPSAQPVSPSGYPGGASGSPTG